MSGLQILPAESQATRHSDDSSPTTTAEGAPTQAEKTEKMPEADGYDNSEAPAIAPRPPIIPMRYRLMSFWMILFFATGSSYAESTLSPLKSTLRKELKITNAQYGAIASASSLVNTILPIIGGIGMDHWGAT
jgi:hypothetical protein